AVLDCVGSNKVVPADLCVRGNSVMFDNIVSHTFISCFYTLLDTKSRKISFANAGHCPPMLMHEGTCVRLKEGGPVLGIFPDRLYSQDEIELRRGDCLAFYTDGLT